MAGGAETPNIAALPAIARPGPDRNATEQHSRPPRAAPCEALLFHRVTAAVTKIVCHPGSDKISRRSEMTLCAMSVALHCNKSSPASSANTESADGLHLIWSCY